MRQTTPDMFVSEPDDMPARRTARVFAPPAIAAAPPVGPKAGQQNRRPLSGIGTGGNPGLVRSLARLSTASRQPTPADGLPGSRLLALFIVLTLAGWTLASFSLGSNDWHARSLPAPGHRATAQAVTAS